MQLCDLATFQRYKNKNKIKHKTKIKVNTNLTVITPFLPPHVTFFIFNLRMDIFRYNDT